MASKVLQDALESQLYQEMYRRWHQAASNEKRAHERLLAFINDHLRRAQTARTDGEALRRLQEASA